MNTLSPPAASPAFGCAAGSVLAGIFVLRMGPATMRSVG
jgi:hypothetical protein